MITTERLWAIGNSCVITIKEELRDALKLKEGDLVEVEIKKVSK